MSKIIEYNSLYILAVFLVIRVIFNWQKSKMDLKIIKEKLKKFNQEHLLKHYDLLNEEEQHSLLNDIQKVDLDSFFEHVERCNSNRDTINDEMKSRTYEMVKKTDIDLNIYACSNEEKETSKSLGMKAIANNELAIVLLAGGQSKRLSISYPKGAYSIGLLSEKSLFQLQAERLIKIKQLALKRFNLNEPDQSAGSIPWYIMTSDSTHNETIEFFEDHAYFGLNRNDVCFFRQRMLPCLDKNNKLILKSKDKLCKAPNGSGGLYEALLSNNVLDDMSTRGVKYVHIYFIDNVLVKMADPLFTGACIQNEWQCAAKVVNRYSSDPPSNVFQSKREKRFINPSNLINDSERYRDWSLDIVDMNYYFFTFQKLKETCLLHDQLKYFKFASSEYCIGETTEKAEKRVVSKIECYLTDLFPSSELKLFYAPRSLEFISLLYMKGAYENTKYGCLKDFSFVNCNWLQQAGGHLHIYNPHFKCHQNIRSCEEEYPILCEISPLVSYEGEGLEEFVKGRYFEAPLCIEFDRQTNQITFNGLDFETFHKCYPTDVKTGDIADNRCSTFDF